MSLNNDEEVIGMEAELVRVDIQPLLDTSDKSINSSPSEQKKATGCIHCIGTWLSNPKTILFLSTCFFTGYISFIYFEGGFSQQFLHFGPGTDESNTTQFLGIVLDTWPKVYLMYLAGFISSAMSTYYNYAMINNLHSYIWNRAVPKVPFSKRWTYVVILAEPFFYQVLGIISFFTSLTMQLQFIIPQFIGGTLIEIPFAIQRLTEKEFEFA
jgi:hypothetical protein